MACVKNARFHRGLQRKRPSAALRCWAVHGVLSRATRLAYERLHQ
jgi:hypothetical protein